MIRDFVNYTPKQFEALMSDTNNINSVVFAAIADLLEDKSVVVDENTPLIGDGSVLDSMKLIELCLTLEEKASDMDFEFDWTSDAAMSKSRSMFRTAGSLASEFIKQFEDQK